MVGIYYSCVKPTNLEPDEVKRIFDGKCSKVRLWFSNIFSRTQFRSIDVLVRVSDWYLISPYNTTLESDTKLMRIKEMITN